MRTIITGGAGFIGFHVAEKFTRQGHEVCIVDNLSTGTTIHFHPSWQFFKTDICDSAAMNEVIEGADVVVHLAAFTSVQESFERFRECYRTNVEGTYRVLEACAQHSVRRFVFASSSAVYAGIHDTPKSEDDCPEPVSPYAVSKLEGEHLLQIFESDHGLSSIALRFFNVYGPRQLANSDYAAVIPIFIQSFLEERPLTIYGDGHQTRDFVFVRDVADAVYRAAVSSVTGIYNVGTGQAVEVLELASTIAQVGGSDFRYSCKPLRPGDIRSSTADVRKIKGAFGWSRVHSLEQGLKETFLWYQKNRKTEAVRFQ